MGPERTGGPVIVALGDSVTAGVGDSVVEGRAPGWVGHLADLLGGPAPVVLGHNGSRVRDVLAEQLPRALEVDADIATLLVGGNDVLRSGFDADLLADQVRGLCLQLNDRCDLVVVVLLHDPAGTLPAWGGVADAIAARAHRYNQAVLAAVGGLDRVVVVDPASDPATARRSAWSVDRMHPSPEGHRVLASLVAERLAAHGFPTTASLPEHGAPPPGVLRDVWWLLTKGTPWALKRSVDLLPELVGVVVAERRSAGSTAGSPRGQHSQGVGQQVAQRRARRSDDGRVAAEA